MAGATPSSTHPPLPPTTEEDRFDRLRLLRSRRVGIATWWRLMEEHGSARAALDALPEIARAAGVDRYEICPAGVVTAEIRAGRAAGARLLAHGEPGYPADLATIADAPPLLWLRGDAALMQRPMVALVGARNASSLGTRMARALAADLGAAGYVVVSGLARGIDAAAHAAALDSGTVAVMAGGIDVIYPPEHAGLAERIAARGVLVSEQPPGLAPQARHFPARNRIVSGIARAVVVVEAAAKSGSLITARNALDQGRDVLAVPGHPLDPRAGGCNLLLRDGAVLVRDAADVIEALVPALHGDPRALLLPTGDMADLDRAGGGPGGPARRHPAGHGAETGTEIGADARAGNRAVAPARLPRSLQDSAALHMQVLSRLGPSPLAEDQLIRDLATPARLVAPVLTELELDGRITRSAGGMVARIM